MAKRSELSFKSDNEVDKYNLLNEAIHTELERIRSYETSNENLEKYMNLEKSSMNTFQKNETNNISLINQLNEDVLLISSQLNEISSVNKCSESVILEKQHSKNQLS